MEYQKLFYKRKHDNGTTNMGIWNRKQHSGNVLRRILPLGTFLLQFACKWIVVWYNVF